MTASDFLDGKGLKESLTDFELDQIAQNFSSSTSLGMYPSFLQPKNIFELPEDLPVLSLGIGGTHIYTAKAFKKDTEIIIENHYQAKMNSSHFENANQFFEAIATQLKPIISSFNPSAVGIVYSFPGIAEKTSKGVDIISQSPLPKNFTIPGIETKGVGEGLIEVLTKLNPLYKDLHFAVMNDTVAVLLSADAKIGGVVGTGTNIAVETKSGIINTESGGFDKVPPHYFAQIIDQSSTNPGKKLIEKQISGLYLGQQLKVGLAELERQGILKAVDESEITAATISEILGTETHWQDGLMPEDVAIYQLLSKRLANRSAQLFGTLLAASINTYKDQFPETEIKIPIEGSVFWGIPGYQALCEQIVEKRTGKKITFLNIPEASLKGAAVAALSQI